MDRSLPVDRANISQAFLECIYKNQLTDEENLAQFMTVAKANMKRLKVNIKSGNKKNQVAIRWFADSTVSCRIWAEVYLRFFTQLEDYTRQVIEDTTHSAQQCASMLFLLRQDPTSHRGFRDHLLANNFCSQL